MSTILEQSNTSKHTTHTIKWGTAYSLKASRPQYCLNYTDNYKNSSGKTPTQNNSLTSLCNHELKRLQLQNHALPIKYCSHSNQHVLNTTHIEKITCAKIRSCLIEHQHKNHNSTEEVTMIVYNLWLSKMYSLHKSRLMRLIINTIGFLAYNLSIATVHKQGWHPHKNLQTFCNHPEHSNINNGNTLIASDIISLLTKIHINKILDIIPKYNISIHLHTFMECCISNKYFITMDSAILPG